MRTNVVDHARKSPGPCGKCGKEIAVGASYKWIQGYRSAKRIRCAECPDWRPSEMTGSDKLSRLYAAREAVEDTLSDWDRKSGEVSALTEALELAASEAEDVAQEYRDAAEAWNGGGPASDWEEKADACGAEFSGVAEEGIAAAEAALRTAAQAIIVELGGRVTWEKA